MYQPAKFPWVGCVLVDIPVVSRGLISHWISHLRNCSAVWLVSTGDLRATLQHLDSKLRYSGWSCHNWHGVENLPFRHRRGPPGESQQATRGSPWPIKSFLVVLTSAHQHGCSIYISILLCNCVAALFCVLISTPTGTMTWQEPTHTDSPFPND